MPLKHANETSSRQFIEIALEPQREGSGSNIN